jgi:hypothetical protein
MTTSPLPALAAAELPLAAAATSPVAFPRFLQLLNDSVAAAALANATHNELKQHFGRALENSWEKHVSAPFFYGQRETVPGELLDLYYGDSTALHRVEATLRKVNACGSDHPAVDAMRQVLSEFVPVAQRMTALKECIVKRPVKSAEERAAAQRFVPTPATPAATRHLWTVLVQVTERNQTQLVEHFTREYARRLDFFMAGSPTLRMKLLKDPENRAAVDAGAVPINVARGEYELKLDFKDGLVALAKKDATALRDEFIFKVIEKIAPIVETKGNLAGAREVSNTIHVGRLSGMLEVEFADGASFAVDNNVVYSHSERGRQFARFPLTFHNVILPGGGRMKQPSEERMHEIFCAAAAPALAPAPAPAPAPDAELEDDEEGESGPAPRG